jgi:putative transposase
VNHNRPHGIFNHDRHLNSRETFKQNRSAALAEWQLLAA